LGSGKEPSHRKGKANAEITCRRVPQTTKDPLEGHDFRKSTDQLTGISHLSPIISDFQPCNCAAPPPSSSISTFLVHSPLYTMVGSVSTLANVTVSYSSVTGRPSSFNMYPRWESRTLETIQGNAEISH
jgi:hypothetical protein